MQTLCKRMALESSLSGSSKPSHSPHHLFLETILSTYTFHVSSSESVFAAKLLSLTSCPCKVELSPARGWGFPPNTAWSVHVLSSAV